MLSLLLDENISDEVARQVKTKRSDIVIYSVYDWEDGRLKSATDEEILRAAAGSALTLLTYDVNTIPPLLTRLANESVSHAGVVFIDHAVIRSNDFGSLVRALVRLHDIERDADWLDRVYFLPRPN